MIFSPTLKRFGTPPPPRRQGLCTQSDHLWAACECVPRFEALGTPPPPKKARGYPANPPTYWPFLILSPTLKRWGPP